MNGPFAAVHDALASRVRACLSARGGGSGMLLHGPAGCGKTTIAHSLAQELQSPVLFFDAKRVLGAASKPTASEDYGEYGAAPVRACSLREAAMGIELPRDENACRAHVASAVASSSAGAPPAISKVAEMSPVNRAVEQRPPPPNVMPSRRRSYASHIATRAITSASGGGYVATHERLCTWCVSAGVTFSYHRSLPSIVRTVRCCALSFGARSAGGGSGRCARCSASYGGTRR